MRKGCDGEKRKEEEEEEEKEKERKKKIGENSSPQMSLPVTRLIDDQLQ